MFYWINFSCRDSLTEGRDLAEQQPFLKPFKSGAHKTWKWKPIDKLHPKFQSLLFVQVIQDIIITLMEFSYFYLQILLCALCNLIWNGGGRNPPSFSSFLKAHRPEVLSQTDLLAIMKEMPFTFSFLLPLILWLPFFSFSFCQLIVTYPCSGMSSGQKILQVPVVEVRNWKLE